MLPLNVNALANKGRGSFPDLTAICVTIDTWMAIKDRIAMELRTSKGDVQQTDVAEWANVQALINKLTDLRGLANRIRSALTLRESPFAEGETTSEEAQAGVVPVGVRDFRNPLGLTEWTIKPE